MIERFLNLVRRVSEVGYGLLRLVLCDVNAGQVAGASRDREGGKREAKRLEGVERSY